MNEQKNGPGANGFNKCKTKKSNQTDCVIIE